MLQRIVQLKVQRFQQYSEKQCTNINQLLLLVDIYDLRIFTVLGRSAFFLVACQQGFLYGLMKFECYEDGIWVLCLSEHKEVLG